MTVSGRHDNNALDELSAEPGSAEPLTAEAFRRLAAEVIEARNVEPLEDFCGLSPTQLFQWMNGGFDQQAEVRISTPNDLAASPVMQYLRLMIEEAVDGGGSIRATPKGNLPMRLVKQASGLVQQFALAKYPVNVSISEFAGDQEDRFNALHYTRILAELCGIFYKRSGKFHLKKEAMKRYESQGLSAFFLPMFEAATERFNWGYFDGYSELESLPSFWLFMVWRVQQHASASRLFEEIDRAFPDLHRELPASSYMSSETKLHRIIECRFISRFLEYWGFVVQNPAHRYGQNVETDSLELQPLLKQTFQFSV